MADASIKELTHRRVLKIAVPILLANTTIPILGAVDTGVVGQLGQAAPIGAVGIGAIILSSLYWVFGFLRMGTTGLTSQASGAGNHDEVSALLMRALLIGFAAGVVIILLQWPLVWGAFQLSPASNDVEALARDYIRIRVFSAPAAIALFGVTGWLIAIERTRAVLILQLWVNGLNVALDLWFVLGLGWGVEGVAIATFLAEWTGLALGLWLCRRAFGDNAWRLWARIFNPDKLRHMAQVNGDILLRSLMLQAAFVTFLFYGSKFGDVTLAANQILMQFLQITAYALDGFAFSAEALVGQALGARAKASLRRSAWMTSVWGGVVTLGMSVCFAVFGDAIIDAMATAPDVRAEARVYLFWMVLAPIFGIAAWMLDGIFIGATRTRDMRNMMTVSFLSYLIALAILVPIFGNHGLWASMLVMFVVRGITLALKYPALEAAAT